jgi:uncharacterized repeat protein (TIGR01451 family)
MFKSRLHRLFLVLTVLTVLVGGMIAPLAVSADDDVTFTMSCDTPSYVDDSGATFSYTINLSYNGTDRRVFDVSLTSIPGWTTEVRDLTSKLVPTLPIGPAQPYGPDTKTLSVNLIPDTTTMPNPGEFKATLKISSGPYVQSMDLIGIVKARYEFVFQSSTGRLSTSATAGKGTHYGVQLVNNSSVALQGITFSDSVPDGWTATFTPAKVDTFPAGGTMDVDVLITPPTHNTIAGDYMISLYVRGQHAAGSMDVRVTALTPSIWGWVGIIIVLVVIAGLAVLFRQLGRR